LDRVKESLFGILQFEIPGSTVLDLFAGSGNLGIEALSRGAKFTVFNDRSAECGKIIAENISRLGFGERSVVLMLDYKAAIDRLALMDRHFDIVFLDPPYALGAARDAAVMLFDKGLLTDNAVIIAEHAAKDRFEDVPGIYRVRTDRKYGDVAVSILEKDRKV
jgi:16S rRNA (guanine(966)-N(2))-methyltransferase RsmD